MSLVSRILSVREQIGNEWVTDLDTMKLANDMILDSYHDKHVTAREEEECLPTASNDQDSDDEDDEECVNLTDLTSPYSAPSERSSGPDYWEKRDRRFAYDRNAMMMLGNTMASSGARSSPYRNANFDLLCLLATQESIHRVLREYQAAGDEREVSFEYLREFYTSRVATHFDGSVEYGRADDFLEDLLTAPPTMKELEGGSGSKASIGLIDPLRIAEDVIAMRSRVAEEWKAIIANVPQDHMGLRRDLLAKQMEGAVNPSPFDQAEEKYPKKRAVVEEEGFQ